MRVLLLERAKGIMRCHIDMAGDSTDERQSEGFVVNRWWVRGAVVGREALP
jgi:hypothetical protein